MFLQITSMPMPLDTIIMPYKKNCKSEGELLTKFKIARLYFKDKIKQKDIVADIQCHNNTINKIIQKCNKYANLEAMEI